MAEFTNQDIGAINNPITPKAPVADNSSVFNTQAITTGIAGISSAVSGVVGQIKTARTNKALADFSQQQLSLADAVDQGVMTSQAARMRLRANFNAATASSPALASEFAKIQGTIVSTAGLGKVIAEGTDDEQVQRKVTDASISAGFGGSESQVEEYLTFQRSVKEVQQFQAELNLNKSLTAQDQANLKLEAGNKLAKLTQTFMPAFTNTMDEIRANNPAATGTDLINMYTAEFAKAQAFANEVGRGESQERINALLKPLETMFDSYVNQANGSITKTELDNQLSNSLAMTKLNVLASSDKIRTYAATSQLFPLGNPSLQVAATDEILKLMERMENPDGKVANIVDEEVDQSFAQGIWKSALKALNLGKGGDDPVAANESMGTVLDNVNKSVINYEGATDSPSDYKQALSFYASSEYGKYVSANGAAADSAEALSVLERNYSSVLIPLVKNELTEKNIFLLTPRPSSEFIVTEFVNGAMRFKPNPNPTDSDLAHRGRFRVSGEVKRLNRVVAGPINEIIRASAHINGNQDYQKVWDTELAPALGLSTDEADINIDEISGLLQEDDSSANPKEINLDQKLTDSSLTPSGSDGDGKVEVSTPVLDALVEIESAGNPDAVSSAGARGVAQIMPATAKDPGFGLPSIDLDTSTPAEQKAWAGRYLGKLRERYKGNQAFALAAYNWGVGNVDKWIKRGAKFDQLPSETQNYLQQFQNRGLLHGE